ncbi:MAG: hypothetical protein ACR2P6_08510 [Gammaproteobacteria bacterium]
MSVKITVPQSEGGNIDVNPLPLLANRAVCRLREVMLGPAYFWHKWLIEDSKGWAPDRVDRYLENRKPDPTLPIRDKEYISTNLDAVSHWCVPGLVKTMRTGGTTGTPFRFYMDTFLRQQKELAYIFDMWSEVGFRPFDLRVSFRGNVSGRLIKYDPITNCFAVSPSVLNQSNVQELINFLSKLNGFFLHVYPSSLLTLLDLIGENVFRKLPIKAILAGSEAFPPSQMSYIKNAFELPVSHWYGHTEFSVLAKYCNSCDGFHFFPTYGYAEFIGDDPTDVSIVATSYNRIGTRFLRFETGDRAMLDDQFCSQPFPRVAKILGRTGEYFFDGSHKKYAFNPFLFGIHSNFWDYFTAIQFRQSTVGVLDVLIVGDSRHEHEVSEFLSERFPSSVELRIRYVESIEKSESAKHRYFVSELPQ